MQRNKWAVVCAHRKGYLVLADGQVQSPRGVKRKLWEGPSGHLHFMIRVDGVSKRIAVHSLAAFQKYGAAYLEDDVLARHKDGIPQNNKRPNILIGTQQDNMMDIPPHRRLEHARTAARSTRKLSDAEAWALREDRLRGMTYKELSKKYKISKSAISYLLHDKTYQDRG